MYKCVIIDDEPGAIAVLKEYIGSMPVLTLVAAYTDPVAAMHAIANGERLDIVFIDIQMPQLSGLDLAFAISRKSRRIIFSTSYREYGFRAFECGAVGYLLKPYGIQKFIKVVSRALLPGTVADPGDWFLVKDAVSATVHKISCDQIIAVESCRKNTRIYLDDRCIDTGLALAEAGAFLASRPGFVRLHRRFIVAVKNIHLIEGRSIRLKNGLSFRPGGTYTWAFEDLLARYLVGGGPDSDELTA